MIGRLTRRLRARGVAGLMRSVEARMRALFAIPAQSYRAHAGLFRGKKGLEIGGLSAVFARRNIFPVYPIARQLDNCNFSARTVWEDNTEGVQAFRVEREAPPGRRFIAEATALTCIPSGAYDFVLASHMLEHSANPILALGEWLRVLKDEGVLVILLPHKDHTFDHRRPVTTMAHLISDYAAGMTEDDLTHMPEILALHDLALDPQAGDPASFKARSLRNAENRCFHHHVFDPALAIRLVDHVGLQIRAAETVPPMHILVVAQKTGGAERPDNSAYLGPT